LDEKRILAMSIFIIIFGLVLSFIILIPLSFKWQLDKRVTLPVLIGIGLFSGLIVGIIEIFWNIEPIYILFFEMILIITIAISLVLWRFYRDPDRVYHGDESAILSPADGKIIYIKRIEKGMIPFSEKKGRKFSLKEFIKTDVMSHGGHVIGIAMNFLDVHVNRAPIHGKIRLLKHIKGNFISLRREEAIVENERVLMVIENKNVKLGVVQIASRLVRNILPYIHEEQDVERGERIGIIRFGSQVDVIIPNHPFIQIKLHPGEKVIAGMSVIASYLGEK
jgi:phosphatidylserine decarboxylase